MLHKGADGKLGQESSASFSYPPPDPIRLNADFEPMGIVAGHSHSCSLSVGGRVACWGYVCSLYIVRWRHVE